ncbi:MAG: winged helix-turn-helix transcriptional regulator [Deltaproteobacteria bacterium]|nr:winged helix-turn-helix transcriptional regulator [Deltaproteobacteria bacterium]
MTRDQVEERKVMDEGNVKELGGIIKAIYEKYEMLSRWTPEFTAREFLVILAMRDERSYTVSELSRMTNIPMSTTSFLVDNLVKKKIISRKRRSRDRRVVSIRLTEKGRKAVAEYGRIFEKIAEHMLSTLSEDESHEFLKFLRRIMDYINQME